jgi:hypothetical protein
MRPPEDEALLRDMLAHTRRLVHGYASVDHDIVWDVVAGDLAEVIGSLKELLSEGQAETPLWRGFIGRWRCSRRPRALVLRPATRVTGLARPSMAASSVGPN